MSSELEELAAHFVFTYNDKASVATYNYVTYREVFGAAVAFVLKVRGGGLHNTVRTKNKSVAANTVTVSIVLRTFSKAAVLFVCRIRRRSVPLSSLASSLSLVLLKLSRILFS